MPSRHPAALALALLCNVAFAAPQLIIVNADVFTADAARPRAQAVAIEAGRFSAVGGNAEIRALAGPATAPALSCSRAFSGLTTKLSNSGSNSWRRTSDSNSRSAS